MQLSVALICAFVLLLSQGPALTSASCLAARDTSGIQTLKGGPLLRRTFKCLLKGKKSSDDDEYEKKYYVYEKPKKNYYDDDDKYVHHGHGKDYEYDGYYEKEGYYGEKGHYGEEGHSGDDNYDYHRRYARSPNPGNYGGNNGGESSGSDVFYKGSYRYDGQGEYSGDIHSGDGNDDHYGSGVGSKKHINGEDGYTGHYGKGGHNGSNENEGNEGHGNINENDQSFHGKYKYDGEGHYSGEYHSKDGKDGYKA